MPDLSLPGYKYLGPGNKIDKGVPTSYNDWVAFLHDLGYGEIIARGGNPYLTFSKADEVAIQRFDNSDWGGIIGKAVFQLKKKAHEAGLIPGSDNYRAPNQAEQAEAKELYNKLNWNYQYNKYLKEHGIKAGGQNFAGEDAAVQAANNHVRGSTTTGKRKGGSIEPKDDERKRLRGSLDDKRAFDQARNQAREMEIDAGGKTTESSALRTADASMAGGPNGTGETPVSMGVPRELGIFTETRTAILPLTYYVSLNNITDVTAVVWKIRLNCPYNNCIGNQLIVQTTGATRNRGPSNDLAQAISTNSSTLYAFPATLVGSVPETATTGSYGTVTADQCKPAWLGWYEKIYESYHTMETDYRVTIMNTAINDRTSAIVLETMDTYTDSSTGNVTPTDAELHEILHWRNIKHHRITDKNDENRNNDTVVIQGKWKPGQLLHNTVNSEDIKAWYPTGAEPGSPNSTWVEQLTLLTYKDEMMRSTGPLNLNMKVELRYVVQFKDLIQSARYSSFNDTDVTLSFPSDTWQTPQVQETIGY